MSAPASPLSKASTGLPIPANDILKECKQGSLYFPLKHPPLSRATHLSWTKKVMFKTTKKENIGIDPCASWGSWWECSERAKVGILRSSVRKYPWDPWNWQTRICPKVTLSALPLKQNMEEENKKRESPFPHNMRGPQITMGNFSHLVGTVIILVLFPHGHMVIPCIADLFLTPPLTRTWPGRTPRA